MRSYRRWVLAGAVLGLCGLVFGGIQTYRAWRLEALAEGRWPVALSESLGDRAVLSRERTTRSTKRTVRVAFPALLRLVRSWESGPDQARFRSLEVRPAGPGRVEAAWEMVVAQARPSAPQRGSAVENALPDGVRAFDVARPLRASDAVPDPFARAFARDRLRELRVTVQGVAAGSDPRALVSGRVVRIGDRLDVFTIESIDREGVVIRGPGGFRARLRRRVSAQPR